MKIRFILFQIMGVAGVLGLLAAGPAWSATYEVTSSAELSAAIDAANGTLEQDTIVLNAANPIVVDSELVVENPVVIEGRGTTLVGNACSAFIFIAFSSGSVVRDLAVVEATYAFYLQADNITIQGCVIGIDWADTDRTNSTGIRITSNNNLIGGNLPEQRNIISGNLSDGILISGNGNAILGNYIGTNRAGTTAIPNRYAITVSGMQNRIGGPAAGDTNVLSGNQFHAIQLSGALQQVEGNYIGLNSAGTGVVNNGNNAAIVAENAHTSLVRNNYCADRICISTNSAGNTLVGNKVGYLPTGNPTGTAFLDGIVFCNNAQGNFAGLRQTGQGNLIVGPTESGIEVNGSLTVKNGIYGNTLVACGTGAIELLVNGNNNYPAPIITSAFVNLVVSGASIPNDYVEVFVAEKATGYGGSLRFVGHATANLSGVWSVNPGAMLQLGDYVCATASDLAHNTSAFSENKVVLQATPTATPSLTPSATITFTHTQTLTATRTPTHTPSSTSSPTATPTPTRTPTPTITQTWTITPTITLTSTHSPTSTWTPTLTVTMTASITLTTTLTPTYTATYSAFEETRAYAYPSPAMGDTLWFFYFLNGPARVEITIFNLVGEQCTTLTDDKQSRGFERTAWNIHNVAPGIYFYRVTVHEVSQTRDLGIQKMVIIKQR